MKHRITNDGNARDIEEIHKLLKEYNLRKREKSENIPLGIYYEDETGKKRAGLTGETFGNWLCIQYLFVEESLRGQGVGRQIMEAAKRKPKSGAVNMPLWIPFPFRHRSFTRNWAIRKCFH